MRGWSLRSLSVRDVSRAALLFYAARRALITKLHTSHRGPILNP
jgi:hypothetical protein